VISFSKKAWKNITFLRLLNNIAEAMKRLHLACRVLARHNQRNSACEILYGLFGNTLEMPVIVHMSRKKLQEVLGNGGG
jgi:hypothetical protein